MGRVTVDGLRPGFNDFMPRLNAAITEHGGASDQAKAVAAEMAAFDPQGFRRFTAGLRASVNDAWTPATRPRRGPRRRGAGRPAARRLTVVRGGDSGDGDSDPEPEPPQAPLRGVKPRALFLFGCTTCVHCGAVMGHYEGRLWCPTDGCPWGRA